MAQVPCYRGGFELEDSIPSATQRVVETAVKRQARIFDPPTPSIALWRLLIQKAFEDAPIALWRLLIQDAFEEAPAPPSR